MSYRDHEPYHERRLEQQTLDALLRIEELLTPKAPPPVALTNLEDDPGSASGKRIKRK
jgi:hypothetical protein